MKYRLDLEKEYFKFAATHFAIFSKDSAERLHGHNYFVGVSFEGDELDPELGLLIEFNEMKPAIKQICEDLDEYVLLPVESPFIRVHETNTEVEVLFAQRRYTFPPVDCKILPLVNISCEELSRYICEKIAAKLPAKHFIKRLRVSIEETRGQTGIYTHNL
ncbi:MAG: 6-pyruvoyl tetrahydropterin synthase [Bdellovibrionaceae bacterium]|nr:6-pyruvoyl tetrahydropterin synthase [Pseudobdellovibrionaceae bacterium]